MRVRGRGLALLVIAMLAGSLATPLHARQPPGLPHVLVLVSSDVTPAGEIIVRTIRDELSARTPSIPVTTYYLDTIRLAGEMHDGLLAQALVERFRDDPVDVVVSLGPTLAFVQAHGSAVWPAAKLVLGAFEGQQLGHKVPVAAEVVTPPLDYLGTVEAFMDLVPGTRRILLMAGATALDRQWIEDARRALQPLASRLAIDEATAVRWAEVPQQVARLPPDTIVLPVTFFQDSDGFKARPPQFAEYVASAANRPVIGLLGTWMGRGIVGGHLVDYAAIGRQLAGAVFRVSGAPPGAPPEPEPTSHWEFDARQLARWGIDERRLPSGSRVLYREPSAWDRYRTQIIAVGAGLALQALIIAGLAIERRARRRAMIALKEEEARRQRAEAYARVQLHEQAHVHTMAAMGQMAATMAHEMNQPLAAALANAQALRRMIERAGPQDPEITDTVADVISESKRAGDVVKRIRTLARKGSVEFGPVDLDELAADVARLVEVEAHAAGVTLAVVPSSGGAVAHGDRVQLRQVMLNLVQNAIQAAGGSAAARVTVAVAVDDAKGQALIHVTDTGAGFAAELLPRLFEPFVTTKPDGLGLGLAICRTIVELHDGEIRARNVAPAGAEMTVTLPRARPSMHASVQQTHQAVP